MFDSVSKHNRQNFDPDEEESEGHDPGSADETSAQTPDASDVEEVTESRSGLDPIPFS